MSKANNGLVRMSDDFYTTPEGCIDEAFRQWVKRDKQLCEFLGIPDRRSSPSDLQRAKIIYDKAVILDPCAGGTGGDFLSMPYQNVLRKYTSVPVVTADIREDSAATYVQDFLSTREVYPDCKIGLVMSNPPFSMAEDFVRHAHHVVMDGGWVCFLLRLPFLEGQKRNSFWMTYKPKYIFVHSKRPGFFPKTARKYKCTHCKRWTVMRDGEPPVLPCKHCAEWAWNLVSCPRGKSVGTDATAYAHFVWKVGVYTTDTILEVIPKEKPHAE